MYLLIIIDSNFYALHALLYIFCVVNSSILDSKKLQIFTSFSY